MQSLRAVELDIPVFAGGYGTEFYAASARQFEALRPGVKIRLYGDPRIQDQVRVRVIAGHYPDAASAPYVLWPALIRAGKVLDLTPFLAGRTGRAMPGGRHLLSRRLDSWRVEDRIGGLPVSFSCWTIFYTERSSALMAGRCAHLG